MTKRGRGVGPRLNDLQRLEIIRKHQSAKPPLSLRQLARDFGVDEKTIRRVVAASADIEARTNSSAILNLRGQVHRRPTPRFPELERTLVTWIDARQRAKAEISPSAVIDKAKLVARAMGICPDDFKASWGWYDKFSRRYGVRTAFVGGAEVAVEQGSGYKIRETKTLQELHAVMAEYDPEWVFTVEETSLFYDALPFDAELGRDTRNRVTLVVSCNSTGRVMLPICMVGKWPMEGGTPRLGRPALSFPSPYLMQERAWLDRATFGRWYSSVFVPFVRERTSKPVLLVVDGERPGHQGEFEDEGIRAVFLPQKTQSSSGPVDVPTTTTPVDLKTWWSRPLQMSVVPVLKAQYKYLLVQSVLSYHNAPEEVKAALKAAEKRDNGYSGGVHFGHRPTLLDAARLLDQAWGQIPDVLLENCFARANLVPPSKLLAAPAPPTGSESLQEPNAIVARYRAEIASKIEALLATSSLPNVGWITSDQSTPANARDRVRAFLNVDDDSSIELQQQLQKEINDVLCDEAPAALTPYSVVPTIADVNDRDANQPEPERPNLESQIHGLLLGITDVATQLRLLPRTGTDAEKLAPLQLEGCIAAADQIRHCIQVFDRTLRTSNIEEKQTRGKMAAAKQLASSQRMPEGQ